MRVAILVALVACTSGPAERLSSPLPALQAGSATPLAPAPAPPTSAVVGFASRTRVIESRHGGEIKTLAVTPEGAAALSVDDLGGTRLWPVLDGTVEPRVVDIPHGKALAIGADPRGFVTASIDRAGGMTVGVVDKDGLMLQRASLPGEPAFVQVVMTSRGIIATRADHSIARIGSDGAVLERLAAASGERVTAIASRGDKLVVQIDADKRKLRWLHAAPALQWGEWIKTKIEPEGVIAVSPRGTSVALAVGRPAERRLVVIDAATGALRDGAPLMGESPFDVAYADEQHVVVGARGGTRVHVIDPKNASKAVVPPSAPTLRDERALVAGGERVFGSASADLAIVGRAGKEYLGYEIESPTVAAVAPDGNVLIGVGSTFALLDKNLATAATPDFKLPPLASVAELRHVEGSSWLVEWANLDNGRTTAAFIDVGTGSREEIHAEREAVHAIGYDARSRLATFALGESNEVLRFDPKTKKFTRVSGYKRGQTSSWQTALSPLAPALAGGNELLVVTIGDRLTVRWVRDARYLDKGTTLQLDGTFAAADPTGNAYVWMRDGDAFATLIVRDGKRVAKLRSERTVAISPDPAGKRYAEISQHEVSLVAHDGSRAWTLPVPGVNEVHWLSDGALALLGTGGLARVDTATGVVEAARCGWRFGLSKTQHRSSSRVEPLCTQLRSP
ncbi:MAG: hypothetical protein ACKV2T_14745 [Kofleriaceae bacterium]